MMLYTSLHQSSGTHQNEDIPKVVPTLDGHLTFQASGQAQEGQRGYALSDERKYERVIFRQHDVPHYVPQGKDSLH
jgi:hypothetical protein